MRRWAVLLLTIVVVGTAVRRRPEFEEWQAAERVGNLLLCPRNFPGSLARARHRHPRCLRTTCCPRPGTERSHHLPRRPAPPAFDIRHSSFDIARRIWAASSCPPPRPERHPPPVARHLLHPRGVGPHDPQGSRHEVARDREARRRSRRQVGRRADGEPGFVLTAYRTGYRTSQAAPMAVWRAAPDRTSRAPVRAAVKASLRAPGKAGGRSPVKAASDAAGKVARKTALKTPSETAARKPLGATPGAGDPENHPKG